MNKKTTKEVISAYLGNDVPEQVKDSFETWMLDTDDMGEKTEALEELWNDFPKSFESDLPSALSIIADANATERSGSRPRNRAAWISAAAAVILAVVSTALLVFDRPVDVCLASSEGAKGSFVLPDGSRVCLNKGSRLYYSGKLEGRKRKVRLEGEGVFDVTEDASRPFVVEAYDLDITVLGTEFTVTAYDPSKICTFLQEGCVEASGPGLKQNVRLGPDQALIYNEAEGTYVRKAVKAINHTLWIGEYIEFDEASLFDICEALAHWYNLDISCSDETFAMNTKLSFTVRQEPHYEIMKAIEALVPVKCTFEDQARILITH